MATYFLRELGMILVRPKKGIYKDDHERPDTVVKRRHYTSVLDALKKRERTFKGVELQIEVLPEDKLEREVVRVYHDECIYASHEGAIQLWVSEGKDGKYKKPRGEIVMASGFICRSNHIASTRLLSCSCNPPSLLVFLIKMPWYDANPSPRN
jgi:hypothetical protein